MFKLENPGPEIIEYFGSDGELPSFELPLRLGITVRRDGQAAQLWSARVDR